MAALDLFYPDGKCPVRHGEESGDELPPRLLKMDFEDLADPYSPVPGDRWGGWYLTDVDSLILDEGKPGKEFYEVDLDRVRTSIDATDWIYQVAHKGWATHEIVGDLIRALECCVGPLQAKCHHDRMRVRGAA